MSTKRLSLLSLGALVLAVAAAAPALAQTPPAGSFAVNYNRCDNDYNGWGLHLWKDPGIPIPGVEWQKPLPATGKSDFGVYWVAEFKEFPKNKVNYIIHKGDSKEQGGRDMTFDGNTVKEIWINSGDRKIYTSLDDAKKARAAKPCS